jgi:hypothetical protein
MRKSDLENKVAENDKKSHGNGRMLYGWPGDLPDQQPFEVWFVNTTTGEQRRIEVPIGMQYEDGKVLPAQWTAENLIETLQNPLKSRLLADLNRFQHAWMIEIRQRKMQPGDNLHGEAARIEAERRILAGPDTPGKRWLTKLRAQGKTTAQGIREILKPAVDEPKMDPTITYAMQALIEAPSRTRPVDDSKPVNPLAPKPLSADERGPTPMRDGRYCGRPFDLDEKQEREPGADDPF